MIATVCKDGVKRVAVEAQNSIINPVNTQYVALHLTEARPVPVLGEVHGPLPLDGEAAAPEQLVPVSVISEVVKQLQSPVDINSFQLYRTPTFEVSILSIRVHLFHY